MTEQRAQGEAELVKQACGYCYQVFEYAKTSTRGGVHLYCSNKCRREVIKIQKREAQRRARDRQR